MVSRRTFLANSVLAAGTATILASYARALAAGQGDLVPAPARLRSVSTPAMTVEPGPWTALPRMPAGVYVENVYLSMDDGVRLNAFVYLPETATATGAVLTAHPYRMMPRSDPFHALNGLAAVYIDLRGAGGSEGVPLDEYTAREHRDLAAVIGWIAAQPWCNGNVGMFGSSYSAFNALQVAYDRKPPALKAIFLEAGTDRRYTDDIHYPGGAMLMVDNSWALGMLAMNVMPGAPAYLTDDKAAMDRWDAAPWLLGFLKNQIDGPYWDHGSLAPDYDRLEVPTYLVGGTLDIYQNQVLRIMRNSTRATTRGILGPWHHYMDMPGPAIDLAQIQLRWFDHWLNGKDTGMMEEPRAAFYMPRWRRQSFRFTDGVPGEWRFIDAWPQSAFEPDDIRYLVAEPTLPPETIAGSEPAIGTSGTLAAAAPAPSVLKLRYHPGRGGSDQSFGPTGSEGFYGLDRRDEDPYGLSFDSAPLTDPLEILGFAKARLFVESSAPVANWIVRICDLAPDGTSYLVVRGYLNGTHRHSHRAPEPMQAGEVHQLDIALMCTAYRFEPGHRIRINIGNADFPVLWPSPQPMVTTLHTGGERASFIALPTLGTQAYRAGSLPPAEQVPPERQQADKDAPWYELRRNIDLGVSTALFNLPLGGKLTCEVKDDDPGHAAMAIDTTNFEIAPDGRRIEAHSLGTLHSTPENFELDVQVTLKADDLVIRTRRWRETIARQLV